MAKSIAAIEKPVPPRQELANRAKTDFKIFIREAWKTLEPGTHLLWNWHIDAIAEHLQALYLRQITRLIIGLSPGHAKSTLVSQMFPVWCWVNDPHSRWLCASHSLDLALRDNVYRRRLIESDWFQANYGDIFQFSGDQNVKSFFQNNKAGYMMALAVRSSGTGKRATALLIDDANNAMAGKADQEATIEWHKKTWASRINDQERGMQVVTGQRLGEFDLINHLLEQGGWEHLCLPEEFESVRRCCTSIGWSDPRTEEGQLLWPQKFPHQVLSDLKKSLGSLDYSAQFQQRPVPRGGYIFRQDDERQFSEEQDVYILDTPSGLKPILKSDCWTFGTVDLAISSKQTADYTVVCLWAVTPANDLLLIHMIRGHWSHLEQQQKIKQIWYQYQPDYISIESVAYQLSIIQDLYAEGVFCREYRPTKDKVSRASGAAIWHSAGKIYFKKNAPWLGDLQEELYLFPKAKHDDIVDNVSMASDNIRARGVMSELEEVPTEETPKEPQKAVPLAVPSSSQIDPWGGDW